MTDPHSKNILVFGSTGGVGKAFVEQALAKGHRVTAFLRDRSKLAVDDPNLTIIDGDLFHEPSVKSALTPDLDTVFTSYGLSNKRNLITSMNGLHRQLLKA